MNILISIELVALYFVTTKALVWVYVLNTKSKKHILIPTLDLI